VDGLFLTGEEKLITECKKKLASEFEKKDLGLMHYFLGLEVWLSPERIFLNQGKYAVEIHEYTHGNKAEASGRHFVRLD
jgi:hypothetical protein